MLLRRKQSAPIRPTSSGMASVGTSDAAGDELTRRVGSPARQTNGAAVRTGRWTAGAAALAMTLAFAARAGAAPPSAAPPNPPPDDIVVTAKRLPGAVIGDIKPELQLVPEDIQSYGVSTIAELLDELAPETRSDRGRGGESPVVLLNGHRISSFNEIRDIPTEAILRVDILPEEVSLKYGYDANQRVVNIVLKPQFHAITAEATGSAPTEGGQERGQAEGDLFHLQGDSRLNIDLRYSGNTALTDHDRGVIETTSGPPYDLLGNVVSPTPGAQIDPALSAAAGKPVTITGVPALAAGRAPTLADFVAGANTPNLTDISRDRTLAPVSQAVTLNAVRAAPGPFGANLTLNGTLGASETDAREGLAGVTLTVPNGDPFSPFSQPVNLLRYDDAFGPLRQTTTGWTGHLGLTANKDTNDWRYSLTSAYDHADSLTVTDAGLNAAALQALLNRLSPTFNPFGPLAGAGLTPLADNTARAFSDKANAQFLASGSVLRVPAGAVFTSLKAGDVVSNFESRSFGRGLARHGAFFRNNTNVQANFDLPLLSEKTRVLPALGDVSLNGNLAVDELSDFGPLYTYGFGVNWTPITGLNLIVSQTHDQAAPTQQQLGNPLIATPGQRLFDSATGQTVLVNQITGGNAALIADSRTVSKIGLTWKPWASQSFTVSANYIASDIRNPIATFPAATAEIEAAFPDRFVRDASGQLTQVDLRPVNFADQRRSEVRWGFNLMLPIGNAPPPSSRERRARGPAGALFGNPPPLAPPPTAMEEANGAAGPAGPGGGDEGGGPNLPGARRMPGGGFGGGRGGGRRGGEGGGRRGGFQRPNPNQGRFSMAVYHTLFFTDQILVRKGGPVFDLLNGSAASATGGQPRNEVEAQLGYTQAGYGARLSFDWKQGTTVKDPTAPTGDLMFSDIATTNLRLWVGFDAQPRLLKQWPFLKGSRLTLFATNLFDQRVGVHDATGATPLSFQPAYLDPIGRVVGISFRKVFE